MLEPQVRVLCGRMLAALSPRCARLMPRGPAPYPPTPTHTHTL
jgi:hypothetical protein